MRIVTTMMLTLALLLGACNAEAPPITECTTQECWSHDPTSVWYTGDEPRVSQPSKPMLSIEQMMDRMNARDGSYPEQVRER